MGNPESFKMHRFPYILHDFLGGVGSVGSKEPLNMCGFQICSHDIFGGVGNV